MNDDLLEVRWHARGGQGAVTASRFLSEAAIRENKHFQAFPEFGTERMGAPIRAFTRVGSETIYVHSQVNNPDAVVVLDPTLLGPVNVTEGLKDDGVLIVNYSGKPSEIREMLKLGNKYKVYTVDATKIARETIGRPITNTAMVGALVRVTGVVKYENVLEQLKSTFGGRFRQDVVDRNVKSLERAFQEVVSE